MTQPRQSFFGRIAPALTLMFLAPMMAEVLPGATRFSSIFVFPIEMVVWGGGAVLIRGVSRRFGLDWRGMLLLAISFAVAEEFLIQQTSLAPMVIKLKGQEWARAYGVNYVYVLWALIYESVMVVMAPVLLTELIFPSRRKTPWLSMAGASILLVLFSLGCFLAWFTWTQMARVKIFHQSAYSPPAPAVAAAAAAIALLWFSAFLFFRGREEAPRLAKSAGVWVAGLLAAVWSVVLYGIVVLAFGLFPEFPPAAAVAIALVLAVAAIVVIPAFARDPRWRPTIAYGAVTGLLLGSMSASFLGFVAAFDADFWFKAATNVIAVILLIVLGFRRLGEKPA
jgi:hypothetical protein